MSAPARPVSFHAPPPWRSRRSVPDSSIPARPRRSLAGVPVVVLASVVPEQVTASAQVAVAALDRHPSEVSIPLFYTVRNCVSSAPPPSVPAWVRPERRELGVESRPALDFR